MQLQKLAERPNRLGIRSENGESSVYCEGTNSRIKVPSPERVGTNVVVMTVTAANLPPALQFGSRLLVCHKCSSAIFLGHVVVCRQDRQYRAIPYRGKTLG